MQRSKAGWARGAAVTTLLTVLAIPATSTAQTADPPADCPWMDTALTADQRARLLLDASTLEQKLRWLNEQPANNPTQTTFNAGGGATATYPAQVPCTPVITYADGPFGIRGQTGVTAYPAPISQAASFDANLSYRKGQAMSYEAYHKRLSVVLGPGIASGRTPLSGRNAEYFGEDPLLSGRMAGANIRGLQADDGTRVAAVVKHYVANEQELDRQRSSSNLDERTLHELYTLPFTIALADGDPAGVMCAYNQVNGVYSCEHEGILTRILRREDGYQGFVMSDFGAVHSLASTPPSLVAGLDQELNRPRFWSPAQFHAALDAGAITEADLDRAAFRVVRALIKAGLFDQPRPATAAPDVSTPENQATALDLAVGGSVLLKNDRVDGRRRLLPLGGGPVEIAVIGPTASATPTNGVSARTVCSGLFQGQPFVSCPAPAAALDAITARAARDGGTVTFDAGGDPAAAAAVAAAADVAVVFGYATEGEFNDRPDLSLAGNGDALIAAVAAANPRTVVVLQTGGPVLMPWLDGVEAVLEVWYAGMNQGPAIAKLLWGDANPSGKLPQTFPRSLADLPTAGSPAQYPGVFADGGTTRPPGSTEIRQVDYAEGLRVGYRWYASQGIRPLFPFGHGLSYTDFEYSRLRVTPRRTDGTKEIRIRFRLTNVGRVAGTEVAQAYVELPPATGEPSKRLVGWAKVALEPGVSKQVEIALSAEELAAHHLLAHWDTAAGRWATADGPYRISVGTSFDTELSDTFTVRGR